METETEKQPIDSLGLLLSAGKGGSVIFDVCTENIYRILTRHNNFKGRFRYDAWRRREEILDGDTWRDMDDMDTVIIQCHISRTYSQFRKLDKTAVYDAIVRVCRENTHDKAKEYLDSLVWDEEPRLFAWMEMAYGVTPSFYHSAVGENFFKGMVARILYPGCKNDAVLILEGKQGCGKTTSLEIIATKDWHLETSISADNKDFFQQMQGKLIVEMAEGETMSRTETKKMKAVISTRVDTFRPPYGRIPTDYPRRCVFAMTTNNDEYLKDETGNRRFFPVEIPGNTVDNEWLAKNRDQLFAEAKHRVAVLKENFHEYPYEDAEALRNQKMVSSGLEDAVSEWIEKPLGMNSNTIDLVNEGTTITDVWRSAIRGSVDKFPKYEEMRVAQAMKTCGLVRTRRMVNGEQKWRWFLTEK